MRQLKAEMFNREASDPKNKPNKILEVLALKHGQMVADIGAGGGYFTLRFAEAVGKDGRVFAVDTNPKFLEFINDCAKKGGLDNVETILAAGENLALPKGSLDLIFMRNVCHHLQDRVEYFRKLRHLLKPNGRIAIIERAKPLTFHGMFGHYVPRETIIKEMKEAEFLVNQDFDFLPGQSFIIFA